MASVETVLGPIDAADLGTVLMHEHVFVRDPELERNLPDLEWDVSAALGRAIRGLREVHGLGVRTIVDLTVLGLGRDVALVEDVARRVSVNIVVATGLYSDESMPIHFRFRGPGRLLDGPEPLIALFVRDIEQGIADTGIRAGMLKVMSGAAGLTQTVERVMTAAAVAHQQTGVPITTHSDPRSGSGLEQQAFLMDHGVAPSRIIIGHSGDSDDMAYLRAIMDAGSTIGMDRFGMAHVLSDEVRIETVVNLAGLGYADRMVLSHDAAFYSHVTPPSWRAAHAPQWEIGHVARRILPTLRDRGVSDDDLHAMLVANPRRLLTRGRA